MHTATVAAFSEPRIDDTEAQSEEMEQKPQSAGLSLMTVVIAALTLILGVIGGLLASVATNSEWKGQMDSRMKTMEQRYDEGLRQREHDSQAIDYVRTQNEIMGRSLVKIETWIEQQKGRR